MKNEFLLEKLKNTYDDNVINKIFDGLMQKKRLCFRVNNLKSNYNYIKNFLFTNSINYKFVDFYNDAFVILDEIDITKYDIYKNGYIYVQNISSMIPPLLFNYTINEDILDMCSAPGSKATEICSLTNNKINLTCVEQKKDRFERLKYNLNMQNAKAYTININALDLNNMLKFDKILLDAPCSGSGIINLNSNYEKYFTNNLISKCINTQKKLVDKAINILKKDGELIYSTCSLLKEENEEIVDYIMQTKKFSSMIFNIIDNDLSKYVYKYHNMEVIKVLPNDIYEGFFVAKFKKN